MPQPLHDLLKTRARPPVLVVLGSPREAADLVADFRLEGAACYQMDLHQAGRLDDELRERDAVARVVTAADLWDLPADFQTAVYPVAKGGERLLKIDMVEQAFHVLRPHGSLFVLPPDDKDLLFPDLLKKVFGRVHLPVTDRGVVPWSQRQGDRPRRRHEVTFQARFGEGESLRFVSRPGVFSYGRFDEGARALIETMEVRPGDRVLDLGCGVGVIGVWAGKLCGPDGHVTFVDSNVRATALADLNARGNGLAAFEVLASSTGEELPDAAFDVALANPPYYAQSAIAAHFISRSRDLLRPGGRFYLVTRMPDQVGPMVAELFGPTEPVQRRGYTVLCAEVPG